MTKRVARDNGAFTKLPINADTFLMRANKFFKEVDSIICSPFSVAAYLTHLVAMLFCSSNSVCFGTYNVYMMLYGYVYHNLHVK